MASHAFYPFVEPGSSHEDTPETPDQRPAEVRHAARIAVYDDAAAAPRVVVVDPTDVRSFLEEVTATVTRLAQEQGGSIPFMVVREIVENLIHAYFAEPTISILDGGDTIRFADQGPGIADKDRALQYGTTSATDEMKRYIRGVGSGLPYVQQYLIDKGGSLVIEDNLSKGTVVTISMAAETPGQAAPDAFSQAPTSPLAAQPWQQATPSPYPTNPQQQGYQPYQQPTPYPAPFAYPQQGYQQGAAQVSPAVAMPGAQPPYAQPTGQPWPAQQQGGPWASPVPQQAPQQPVSGTPLAPAALEVSERGQLALAYLAAHGQVGPTELVEAHGHSQSTWTRELKALETMGLIAKRGGQKRYLTTAGHAFLGV